MKYRQTVVRTDSPPTGWTKPKLSECLHMKSGDMITAKRIFEVEAYPVYGGNGLRGFTDCFNREGGHSLIGRQGALCGAVHFADGQFYASEHAIVAKALGKNDQRFLTYVLDALNLNEVSEASAQPGLSVEKLRSIEILCPTSHDEQQAIAAALSDADGVVAGLERVITKKRLIKQGAMQDLLTARRRLPGFSGDWEVKKLAQLGDVKTGLTYKPENVKPFGTLVLRSSNIQNDRLAFESNVFVDVDVSDEATVKTGDLLICVRNGSRQLIGKTAMIDSRADGMAFGAFMSAFRSEINDYLLWCFQSFVVQNQIAENLGATINQITNKTMKGIEIPLPKDETERRAITAVLSDMDAEIQTLETRLAKARAVKEGMMQNLLTGRVRLV